MKTAFWKYFFIPAVIIVISLSFFIRSGFFIQNVAVDVSPSVPGLTLWGSQSDGQLHPLAEINQRKEFIKSIVLQLPAESVRYLESVTVTIGTTTFPAQDPVKTWPQQAAWKEGKVVAFLESPVTLRLKSFFFKEFINWGGIFSFKNLSERNLFWMVIGGITLFYFLLCAQYNRIRSWLGPFLRAQRDLLTASSTVTTGGFFNKEFFVGLIFLIGCLSYLELTDPYYFTQDDSLTQFLPVILQACEGFFKTGMFPMINAYQVMGSPNAVLGTYALTYPITYLSYFIAADILRNPYATLEVFAFIHFIGGYVALVWFFRLQGIKPIVGVLAALSFVLCGYNLMVGRSWYYMLPVMMWLPILMAAVEIFRSRDVSTKWVLLTGMALGIFFHAGNAQMWIYTLMFLVIALGSVILQSERKLLKLFYASLALGLAILIALPLALIMSSIVQEVDRVGGQGSGIWRGLWAMIFPYPLAKASHDIFYQDVLGNLAGQLYYAGTIFTVAGFYAVIVYFLQTAFGEKNLSKNKNIWVLPLVLAFVLALGEDGLLWTLLAQISPFSKFNHPFKFLPFVHLFLITMGAVLINNFLEKRKFPKAATYVIYICVFALLFYHVSLCKKALRLFAADPYPVLSEDVKKVVSSITAEEERIYAMHEPAPGKDFVLTMPFTMVRNFATIYKLPSLSGYEPLLLGIKADAEHLAQYGVKYLFLDPAINMFSTIPSLSPVANQIKQVSFKDVVIYQLPNALPMAFLKDDSRKSFPLVWTPQGASVDIRNLTVSSEVVVNLFFREGYAAFVDGKKITLKPDEYNRILVNSPPGKTLDVRYMPGWPLAVLIVIVSAIIAVAAILNLRSRLRLFE